MSGQCLKMVEKHSYLEVIINYEWSWKLHIDYVYGKAMKLIDGKVMKLVGFLNHNLHTCLKELSYKQFVLPMLNYASSIWDCTIKIK